MKIINLAFVLLFSNFLFGQITITNQSPHVSTDFKKILYLGFENPVNINTGSIKNLKVSVQNGTIKKTVIPGKVLITPINSGVTTIVLTGNNFKKSFEFEVRIMKPPEVQFDAHFDPVPYLRQSVGIYVGHRPTDIDIDIKYVVDSFTVRLQDSTSERTHLNIGPKWDSVTTTMIREARPKAKLSVYGVYVTGGLYKKSTKLWSWAEGLLW